MGLFSTSQFRARLVKLGLTTDPDTVLQVVAHLSRNGSQYALHQADPPIVSKATARKIKRLLDGGRLGFLTDLVLTENQLPRVFPVIGETEEDRLSRERTEGEEQAKEIKEYMTEPDPRISYFLQGGEKRDPFRHARLESVKRAEEVMPESEWSVDGLERSGVPEGRVIDILIEYDALRIKRISAEIESDPPPERWMMDFPGVDRYIALHYLVAFQQRCPNAPFAMVSIAAELCAKGILGFNNRYVAAGEDIIRYAIWRGEEYRQAYFKSLERYYGTKRALSRFRAQVQAAIDFNSNDTGIEEG